MLVKEFLSMSSVNGRYFKKIKIVKNEEVVLSFSHIQYGDFFPDLDSIDDSYSELMSDFREQMNDMRNDDTYGEEEWQDLVEEKGFLSELYSLINEHILMIDFDSDFNVTIGLYS